MSQAGDLNALYKIAYAKGIEDLIPKASKLQEMISFVSSDLMNGKHYEQPVVLSAEAGFTYSLDTQTAYDLNDSIGMNMQSAQVPGADIVLSSTVGYNQAARASHNATSFRTVMSTKFENMLKSTEKRVDIAILYGSKGIGKTPATQTAVISDTKFVKFSLTPASWATGIWAGSENNTITLRLSADNSGSGVSGSYRIAQVDVDAKALMIELADGTAASNFKSAVDAGAHDIYFAGSVSGTTSSFAFAEMAGLQKIITNTGSLFGISAADYDLWRGNSVAVTGQLSMQKVLAAVSKAVQRGLDSDVVLLVNPNTWADLASNLAAQRRFDGSYSKKKSENGAEEIVYYGQNGSIKVVSYNIVKEGDAFIFPEDKCIRVGAREIGLNDPTRPSDEIFYTIPGKAGVGLRSYTNQAVFVEAPAQCVYISGIVNSL